MGMGTVTPTAMETVTENIDGFSCISCGGPLTLVSGGIMRYFQCENEKDSDGHRIRRVWPLWTDESIDEAKARILERDRCKKEKDEYSKLN